MNSLEDENVIVPTFWHNIRRILWYLIATISDVNMHVLTAYLSPQSAMLLCLAGI